MPYEEPTGNTIAGRMSYKRQPAFYEQFMAEQNIPVVRGIGIRDSREVDLAPWERMGGRGAFIQFDGTEGGCGMYLLEVPGAGELKPERHIYEERLLVIEGRGTTEVWRDGSSRKQMFEWQPGSFFSIPVNLWHRMVNASRSPALILGVTTAPITMNLHPNADFIFNNPFEFTDRYDDSSDYFKPRDELEPHPESGRALLKSNLIPDIANCALPLDNSRGPGYRWISPQMAGNTNFGGFIAEYPSGRYSKAHYHISGAVLVCLRGKGYTYNWPVEVGTHPWEDGKEQTVKVAEYVAGGMVAAAPGGGNWFHQHFSISQEPLRVINITGTSRSSALSVLRRDGDADRDIPAVGAEIGQGGYALPYRDEDPYIRTSYQEALAREGAEFQMPMEVYG
ncbi:MAG TPA: cupin domain-containing protein [Chloroflexota bacterium]|jgi:quercetin dioxygenase-like cupin family protein|nr:cupin domain-containing protein [Chloroflexota bacterium]